jgi:diguanylate cyclase (GGDEF)-like protein
MERRLDIGGNSVRRSPAEPASGPPEAADDRRIRVLIADKHSLLRQALHRLLALQSDIEVVAELDNGRDLIATAGRLDVDVILMDLRLPVPDAEEFSRRLRKHSPRSRIVILSGPTDDEQITVALRAAAVACVAKQADVSELLAAIRSAHLSGISVDNALAYDDSAGELPQAPGWTDDGCQLLTARNHGLPGPGADVPLHPAMVRHLIELAYQDELTGLGNRRAFEQRLAEETERARRTGHALSLLLLDMDSLKALNDTYGHPTGDAALCTISRRLRELVGQPHIAVRYGGDEFAVLLLDTNLASAAAVAEQVRAAVAASEPPEPGHQFQLTVSIGVSEYGQRCATGAGLLKQADAALFQAKRRGGNQVVAW